jgi:DNA-directed RNA polymerase specialized sigma24 family protein
MQKHVIQIAPLTRRNAAGALLKRSAEVEAQILRAREKDDTGLIENVHIRDHTEPDFIQEESLVHLIRVCHQQKRRDLVDPLLSELIRRVARRVDRTVRIYLDERHVDECYSDVIVAIIAGVLDIQSDKEDFAEVRFWPWLKGKAFGVLRTHLRQQRKSAVTDSLSDFEADVELSTAKRLPDALVDAKLLADKKTDILEVLSLLTDKQRLLFLIRHYYGWPIEGEDENKMTISRYYGVTSRTVRNWFEEIDEKIAAWHQGRSL